MPEPEALDFLPAVKDWMAEVATRPGSRDEGMELVSMKEGSGLRLLRPR